MKRAIVILLFTSATLFGQFGAPRPPVDTLSKLRDVAPTVSSATDGQVLTWDNTLRKWKNSSPTVTVGGSPTEVLYNNSGAIDGISGATTDGTTLTLDNPTFNRFTFSGNINATAWGANGLRIKAVAQTFDCTSCSGSISGNTISSAFGGATIRADAATTFANYINGYFKDPIAGTNVTINNKYALGADSAIFGTSPTLTISNAGALATLGGLTSSTLTLSGNVSAAAWGGSGIGIKGVARTLTDTTSSGTVTGNTVTNSLGGNTIAATNATTYAAYISTYLKEAIAGTNVTMTSKYALGADSAIFGTSNQATFSLAGLLTVPGSIDTPTVTGSGGNLVLGGGSTTTVTETASGGISFTAPSVTLAPAGAAEELRFREDFASGVDYIGFKAPSSIPAILHYIFPATDAAGALTSDGSGNLSWTSVGGGNVSNSGTPTSGQLALWTNATTIQGLTALPAANFPALTGEVTTSAGSLATTVGTLTHNLNLGTNKATNVVDPTSAQDAATKNYVDTTVASFDAKPSVGYASTSALPANTYANGSSGVGATLTGNSNGPLVIDSVTLAVGAVGQRILVTGESTAANDGWYTVTQVGVVAVSPYILTRATESDQAAEIGAGYLTSVTAPNTLTPGSANNGKVFISVAADPFTVGTTSLTFSQVGGTYAAGTGLSLSGSTFSIDTATTVDKTTAQVLTNKDLTSGTNTFPTFNQNTTGSAAKLTTARAIGGVNFDGTAAIVPTNISGGNSTTLLGSIPYQSNTDTTTQLAPNTTTTKKFLRETGSGTNGAAPAWDTIVSGDVPTLNQNSTGSAASLSISGQTGLMTVTGLTSTNRAKTVRDAADTIIELGGSYTPTGTWTLTNANGTADGLTAGDVTRNHAVYAGASPPTVDVGVFTIVKTGVDLKTAGTTDIFTVPTSRTFVCQKAVAVVTSVTTAGAGTQTFKIVESGAASSMTAATASGSGTPAVGTYYVEDATPAGAPYKACAAANKVQITVSTSHAGSTAVSGSVFVTGYYSG